MGGGGRVDNQRADITDVGDVGVQLQSVNELPRLGGVGILQVEGEYAAGAGKAQLVQGLVPRGARQASVVDLGDQRVVLEELSDGLGVFIVALDAQSQGVEALSQNPGVERSRGSASVAENASASTQCEGRGAQVGELQAVVSLVGLGEVREDGAAVTSLSPVEVATVDDDTGRSRYRSGTWWWRKPRRRHRARAGAAGPGSEPCCRRSAERCCGVQPRQ